MTLLRTFLAVIVWLAIFAASPLFAVELYPFYTFNQSPLVQIYGLPAPDDARILAKGKTRGFLAVDLANNFGIDKNPRESITLDGESYRTTLGLRYGVGNGFEAGLDLPYLVYSGGFLDQVVQGFHRVFGFSQGERDKNPENRLLFQYSKDNVEQFRMDHANSGLGDIRLLAGMQLYHDQTAYPRVVALRTSLKLPTGDSAKFHGSGSTDFALWLTASEDYQAGKGHLTLFGAGGGLVTGRGDVLRGQQQHLVGFGTLGGGWSPYQWLGLKLQVNGHTSFYKNSALAEVDCGSVQSMLGATFALPGKFLLDFAVVDDLVFTVSSPDVTYNFMLRREF